MSAIAWPPVTETWHVFPCRKSRSDWIVSATGGSHAGRSSRHRPQPSFPVRFEHPAPLVRRKPSAHCVFGLAVVVLRGRRALLRELRQGGVAQAPRPRARAAGAPVLRAGGDPSARARPLQPDARGARLSGAEDG